MTAFNPTRKKHGLHWKPPRRRVGASLSRFLFFMAIIGVMGCQGSAIKEAPDEIIGTWETADPLFKGCTMEITPYRIVFTNPLEGMTRNYIMEIRKFAEGTRTLYEITHVNESGLDYLLSLYYIRSEGEEMIRIKNRDEVKWTRTILPGL